MSNPTYYPKTERIISYTYVNRYGETITSTPTYRTN